MLLVVFSPICIPNPTHSRNCCPGVSALFQQHALQDPAKLRLCQAPNTE